MTIDMPVSALQHFRGAPLLAPRVVPLRPLSALLRERQQTAREAADE
jgi:hypothetical protein